MLFVKSSFGGNYKVPKLYFMILEKIWNRIVFPCLEIRTASPFSKLHFFSRNILTTSVSFNQTSCEMNWKRAWNPFPSLGFRS